MPTSYGANKMLEFLTSGTKIAMLDYLKGTADVAGPDSMPGEFQSQHAPRHQGKCNVLFNDGGVQLRSPSSIDPNEPNVNKLWEP